MAVRQVCSKVSRWWTQQLSGDDRLAGLTGLAVLADEGAVLAELAASVGVLHQAVPADAVPLSSAAAQEARAAAIQRLFLAVTADNGDGWSGSAA